MEPLARVLFVLVFSLLLSCCARQAYVPRALDSEAAAAAYAARRLDDPQLQQYLKEHGLEHAPVVAWGLPELTLVAFYFRAELDVARAEATAARAEVAAAVPALPLGVSPRLEHHSDRNATDDTPWSLGFELEIPLASPTRRQALVERAEYLAQSAELDVGAATWRVRGEVREALLGMYAARVTAAGYESEAQLQRSALALLERRLQAGYASATEVASVRVKWHEAEANLASARAALEQARGALAAAIAVPYERLREVDLKFDALAGLPAAPETDAARGAALTNRVDLRRKLLEFGAADSAVKLEVARQYPSFALRPGYLWDQGDNVWSLALDLVLPAGLTYGPAIRAAEARREAAAQHALQQQSAVIAQTDTALATYREAVLREQAAARATQTQVAHSDQLQRRFDAGELDRLELVLGRLEGLLVERHAQAARIDAQRALGALEDALQMPLSGAPAPRAAAPAPR